MRKHFFTFICNDPLKLGDQLNELLEYASEVKAINFAMGAGQISAIQGAIPILIVTVEMTFNKESDYVTFADAQENKSLLVLK